MGFICSVIKGHKNGLKSLCFPLCAISRNKHIEKVVTGKAQKRRCGESLETLEQKRNQKHWGKKLKFRREELIGQAKT